MTPEDFESQLEQVAEIQRDAGWAERSILSYSKEQREVFGKCLESLLFIGAGLACDNSRHGVLNKEKTNA